MRKNVQLESGIWMDLTKKERKYYLVQCINTKKLVRGLHVADVRYHLDCWLGVHN